MSIVPFVIVIVLSYVLFSVLLALICRFLLGGDRGYQIVMGMLIAVFVTLGIGTLGFQRVTPGSLLVSPGSSMMDPVISVFETPVYLSRWDGRLHEPFKIVDVSQLATQVDLVAHPITDNPKVRNLSCQVEIILPPLGDRSQWNAMWVELQGKDPATYAKRLLYDFAEKRSRELSRFYNPLDDVQQQEFRFMVEDDLTHPLLQAGLGFKTARFDLN